MTVDKFEDLLGQVVHRQPFLPFFVEFHDGRVLYVNERVAFSGGGAACITPEGDWLEFYSGDVRDIRLVPQEKAL